MKVSQRTPSTNRPEADPYTGFFRSWKGTRHSIPFRIARTDLFGASLGNRRQRDDDLILEFRDVRISYSGEQLQQDDYDCLLHLYHQARGADDPLRRTMRTRLCIGPDQSTTMARAIGSIPQPETIFAILDRLNEAEICIEAQGLRQRAPLVRNYAIDPRTQSVDIHLSPDYARLFDRRNTSRDGLNRRSQYQSALARYLDAIVSTRNPREIDHLVISSLAPLQPYSLLQIEQAVNEILATGLVGGAHVEYDFIGIRP